MCTKVVQLEAASFLFTDGAGADAFTAKVDVAATFGEMSGAGAVGEVELKILAGGRICSFHRNGGEIDIIYILDCLLSKF